MTKAQDGLYEQSPTALQRVVGICIRSPEVVPSLTQEQAALLRERLAGGETKAKLAREFRISRSSVYSYMMKVSAT